METSGLSGIFVTETGIVYQVPLVSGSIVSRKPFELASGKYGGALLSGVCYSGMISGHISGVSEENK